MRRADGAGRGVSVSPLHIPSWREFPLRDRLAEATGLPTFVDNDAKALALGEGWRGAAAGVDDFVALIVATGVGGGIVLGGRLLDGAGGNAGHVGHVVVEPDGRPCGCGGRGCLEAEASGSAIRAATGRPAEEAGPDVVARTGRMVGRAVASVANLLDLQLAVAAGSVALGFGAPFFAAAQSEIDARCRLSFSSATRIVPAGLGPDAPLVGAAAVGWRGVGRVCELAAARRAGGRRPARRCGRWRCGRGSGWPGRGGGVVGRRCHCPIPAYLRFRSQTAYGDPEAPPTPEDVVAYLQWCKDFGKVG